MLLIMRSFCFSLWGKFAENPDKTKTEYVYTGADLLRIATDRSKRVSNFHILSDKAALIESRCKQEFVADRKNTNIYIGIFTTAHARLSLYSLISKVPDRLLYMDTDSLIYTWRPGQFRHPVSDELGALTSEVKDDFKITSFTSAGPKNYCYTYVSRENNNKSGNVVKVKGFSLNAKNAQLINVNSMRDLVDRFVGEDISQTITTVNKHHICRDKRSCQINSQEQTKNYKVVYNKRVVLKNFQTLPYGY